jgi:hypothetical protein
LANAMHPAFLAVKISTALDRRIVCKQAAG